MRAAKGEMSAEFAPGWPGTEARWTSSAKEGVGTALSSLSRVWFTISHGVLNEIYFPRVDQACTRDFGLIVTAPGFFSEEKRDATTSVSYFAPGCPAYQIVNTCKDGRYSIEKEILSDPVRNVVLQRVRFVPLSGKLGDYRLFALLAPHLANCGMGNSGWVGDYKGIPMLFASRDRNALALACSEPWRERSVGFVGTSDGWQDLSRHKKMEWKYGRAENGNIALTAEIDLRNTSEITLAVGFGEEWSEAGQAARASLFDGFVAARKSYVREWRSWQKSLQALDRPGANSFRIGAAVLRTHESKGVAGATIASLSIPWGFAKGDNDLGGYHVVWPRDLVETAGGLIAAGAGDRAVRILSYLEATQEADGHWPQNMWLDGRPWWDGVQMDETAFPILLVDLLRREKALVGSALSRFWPMVRRAASFLVLNGPVTAEDRWEEDAGYSPFTLAIEIAALVIAADLAEAHGEGETAQYLRETADAWNDSVERWTYVRETDLCRQFHVDGYYIRIAPPDAATASSPSAGFVPIKNRPSADAEQPAAQLISTGFLALVRFGLRAPDDPRITNTLTLVDHLLRVELPQGPIWHRYNMDGYGEHADGAPFDGTGIGRAWPLLTGERAHYELAAGNRERAESLLETLEKCAGEGGLIPEQSWDAADLPDRELFLGRPSGSARPLVWAHAECIKLIRSLRDGRVFDQPDVTTQRYLLEKRRASHSLWSTNNKRSGFEAGTTLRISLREPARLHWSADNWSTVNDTDTNPTGLGTHIADLNTATLPSGSKIVFTLYWKERKTWESEDYALLAS
ncbi:MAG: glucan 1,4-alpha-glucosidase [Acidobacteriota bacterium]|nr:glucan 1,4-alpha-glucosidase [Acidobacteriota bacterium]